MAQYQIFNTPQLMFSATNSGALKVVLLGNSGTGKTSILQYQLNSVVNMSNLPTIGCVYHEVPISLTNEIVTLKVWDTAGQEIYRSIVPIYVRDASAAILVYDISDPTSFASLDQWRSLLLEEQPTNIFVYIVANKIDLDDDYQVNDAAGKQYSEKINAKFFKVSAIKGDGIAELFNTIAVDLQNKNLCISKDLLTPKETSSGCC